MDFKELLDGEEITAELPYAGGSITVRYLRRKEIAEIRNSCIKVTHGPRHEETREVDRDLVYLRVAQAAITGWTGFTVDGDPLPCTPENVQKLFDNLTGLDGAVYELSMSYVAMQILRRAEAAKKSRLTSGIEGTTQG